MRSLEDLLNLSPSEFNSMLGDLLKKPLDDNDPWNLIADSERLHQIIRDNEWVTEILRKIPDNKDELWNRARNLAVVLVFANKILFEKQIRKAVSTENLIYLLLYTVYRIRPLFYKFLDESAANLSDKPTQMNAALSLTKNENETLEQIVEIFDLPENAIKKFHKVKDSFYKGKSAISIYATEGIELLKNELRIILKIPLEEEKVGDEKNDVISLEYLDSLIDTLPFNSELSQSIPEFNASVVNVLELDLVEEHDINAVINHVPYSREWLDLPEGVDENRMLYIGKSGVGKYSFGFNLLKINGQSTYQSKITLFANPEIVEKISTIESLITYWIQKVGFEFELQGEGNIFVVFDDFNRLPDQKKIHWAKQFDRVWGFAVFSRKYEPVLTNIQIREILGQAPYYARKMIEFEGFQVDGNDLSQYLHRYNWVELFHEYMQPRESGVALIDVVRNGELPWFASVARRVVVNRLGRYIESKQLLKKIIDLLDQEMVNLVSRKEGFALSDIDQKWGGEPKRETDPEYLGSLLVSAGVIVKKETSDLFEVVNPLIRDYWRYGKSVERWMPIEESDEKFEEESQGMFEEWKADLKFGVWYFESLVSKKHYRKAGKMFIAFFVYLEIIEIPYDNYKSSKKFLQFFSRQVNNQEGFYRYNEIVLEILKTLPKQVYYQDEVQEIIWELKNLSYFHQLEQIREGKQFVSDNKYQGFLRGPDPLKATQLAERVRSIMRAH